MTCILLQPSTRIQAHLDEACARLCDEDVPDFDMLLRRQVLIVSSATENWDSYIDHLEEEYADIVCNTAI